VGSNAETIDGWINIDLYQHKGVIQHDARKPFPYQDNSIDFIFSEHFIEHLTDDEGILYFKECYRMLKPGGVVRTVTFCVDLLMEYCRSDDLWNITNNELYQGRFSNLTRTQFFNFAVYEGGAHKHMYNIHELARVLELSGFNKIKKCYMKESEYPELQNLEYRLNSTCIVEAVK